MYRVLGRAGIGPQTRLAAIGAPHPLHITRQLFASLRSGMRSSPVMAVTTPLDKMVAELNAYQPDALVTYSSIAALLAEEQLQGRLAIVPSAVFVSSEVLTADAERRIDEAWQVRAFNVYAATEAPLIASGAPDQVGAHVCDDLVIIESVDDGGRPVPAGTPGHKVLLTNLVNWAQPLIRYELSDSIVLAPGAETGRPYSRIIRVDGRSDDILWLPRHSGAPVAVHPYRLRAPFAQRRDVRQYQIVFDGRTLAVRVVLEPWARAGTSEEIRSAIAAAVEITDAVVPPIEVAPTTEIEREPGHAAKFKLVKLV